MVLLYLKFPINTLYFKHVVNCCTHRRPAFGGLRGQWVKHSFCWVPRCNDFLTSGLQLRPSVPEAKRPSMCFLIPQHPDYCRSNLFPGQALSVVCFWGHSRVPIRSVFLQIFVSTRFSVLNPFLFKFCYLPPILADTMFHNECITQGPARRQKSHQKFEQSLIYKIIK